MLSKSWAARLWREMLHVPSTPGSESLHSNDNSKNTGHKNMQNAYPQLSKKKTSSPSTPLTTPAPCFFLRKNETHTKNTPPQQLQPIKNPPRSQLTKKNSPACDIVFSSPDNPNAARSKKALVLGRVAKARFTRQHAARSSAPHSVCTGQVIFFNEKYRYTWPIASMYLGCIYLHLVDFHGKCIGKHTIHGCRGRYTLSCCCDYYDYYHDVLQKFHSF